MHEKGGCDSEGVEKTRSQWTTCAYTCRSCVKCGKIGGGEWYGQEPNRGREGVYPLVVLMLTHVLKLNCVQSGSCIGTDMHR